MIRSCAISSGEQRNGARKQVFEWLGIDDWAWRKGSTYGTIIVDLERREVIDLLPVRSAGATADWFKQYPDIKMISRDRCGSFAQGAHEGAPQARQVADRFHLLQNLREAIQAQLSRATGSSVRPLLPSDDDEGEAVISCSPRETRRRRASLPHKNGEPAFKASEFRSRAR